MNASSFCRNLRLSCLAAVSCLSVTISIATPKAAAQVPESIAVAGGETLLTMGATKFGATKVGDIVKQVQGVGDEWIQQGQEGGNALLTKTGTEAELFAQNLNLILTDQREKTFNELQKNEQLLIAQYFELQNQADQAKKWALDFKDSTVLDLNQLLIGIPFYKDRFFVQRIDGVMQMQKASGDYLLSVWATHLMPYQAGQNTNIQLTLNDKPVKIREIDQAQAGRAAIHLENDVLKDLFASDKMTVAKGRMTIVLSEERSYWYFFHKTVTHEYSFPINFALYPLHAGAGSVSGQRSKFDWVTIETGAESPPLQTANYDCNTRSGDDCGHPDWSPMYTVELPPLANHNPPLNGDQRYVNAVAPNSAWRSGPGNFCQPSVTPWDHGQRVTLKVRCDSGPTTWIVSADVQQWQSVSTEAVTVPSIDLTYDAPFDVIVPHDAYNVKLNGNTLTHQAFSLNVGSSDPSKGVHYLGFENTPDNKTIIYHYRLDSPV